MTDDPTSGPRRRAVVLSIENAADLRRLDCAGYSACLDRAIADRWPSFACGAGCYVPIDDDQRVRDLGGLIFLRRTSELRLYHRPRMRGDR